jgi:hypothetical protein
MFNKFLKFIFTPMLMVVWASCSDSSMDSSDNLIACTFSGIETENAITADCENEEDYRSGHWENCEVRNSTSYSDYNCDDGAFCWTQINAKKTVYKCIDQKHNEISYTEDEFKNIYYTKGQK